LITRFTKCSETRMGSGKESGNAFGNCSGNYQRLPESGKSGKEEHTYIGEENPPSTPECVWGIPITIPTVTTEEESGKLPDGLPDGLPDSNPLVERLPDTSGKSGNQKRTLPNGLPDLPSHIGGETENHFSPYIPKRNKKFSGIL